MRQLEMEKPILGKIFSTNGITKIKDALFLPPTPPLKFTLENGRTIEISPYPDKTLFNASRNFGIRRRIQDELRDQAIVEEKTKITQFKHYGFYTKGINLFRSIPSGILRDLDILGKRFSSRDTSLLVFDLSPFSKDTLVTIGTGANRKEPFKFLNPKSMLEVTYKKEGKPQRALVLETGVIEDPLLRVVIADPHTQKLAFNDMFFSRPHKT